MGWVRVDDAFYDHEKFIAAGPCGIALWLTALGWSNRNLTDGYIPRGQVPRLLVFEGLSWETGAVPGLATFGEEVTGLAVANRLVEVGIFDDAPGGYQIHDYLEFQPSAEQVREKAKKERERWHRRAAGNAAVDADSAPDSDGPPDQLRAESAATPRVSQPQPQTPKNTRVSDAEFEDWWSVWPQKRDKRLAQKRYRARRSAGSTHAELCKARDNYLAQLRDATFCKYGATFLQADTVEEWLDPPPPPSNGHVKADELAW
jgi:hypothetical protein